MIDPRRFDAPRSRLQEGLQVLFFLSFARLFLGLFLGLRVKGTRPLPVDGARVVVANHASHLDTLTLLSLFPVGQLRRVRPAAAADYFLRNAVVAALARTLFHILPIVRRRTEEADQPDPVEQMLGVLDRGEVLLLFPEGTRGEGKELAPFRRGIGRVLAARPDVPVTCVGLRNTGRSLPKGAWLPVPIFVDAAVSDPFVPSGTPEEIAAELQARVEALREA